MTPSPIGRPLDEALRSRDPGKEPPIILETRAPRKPREAGTLRVIRVRDDEWVVARFPDALEEEQP